MRIGYDRALLQEVERRSASLGERLTVLRRQVFALLIQRGGHASAYELINDLPMVGRAASPPPVYRALDFRIDAGLVKRLSTTNSFIVAPVDATGSGHTVFLICAQCKVVEVLRDAGLQRALIDAAHGTRFWLSGGRTEITGVCSACKASANPALGSRWMT